MFLLLFLFFNFKGSNIIAEVLEVVVRYCSFTRIPDGQGVIQLYTSLSLPPAPTRHSDIFERIKYPLKLYGWRYNNMGAIMTSTYRPNDGWTGRQMDIVIGLRECFELIHDVFKKTAYNCLITKLYSLY